MIGEQYKGLIAQLLARTRQMKVDWQVTSSSNEFLVNFKANSLSIASGFDEEIDQRFVAVALRNKDGTEIDRFWVDERDKDFQMLDELYKSARRQALRVDKTIQDLLQELGGNDPVGPASKPDDDDPPF